ERGAAYTRVPVHCHHAWSDRARKARPSVALGLPAASKAPGGYGVDRKSPCETMPSTNLSTRSRCGVVERLGVFDRRAERPPQPFEHLHAGGLLFKLDPLHVLVEHDPVLLLAHHNGSRH